MRREQGGNATPGAFGECATAFAGPVCSAVEEAARRGRVPNEVEDHIFFFDNGGIYRRVLAFCDELSPDKIGFMTPCR